MNLVLKKILLCLSLFSLPWLVFAQEQNPQEVMANLTNTETAHSSLLVLQFGATGMTDSAARAYSMLIAQNLANTNRFSVTNAEKAEEFAQAEAPQLLPCFEIGCGIQIAKMLNAQRVLSGHISLTSSGLIHLQVTLVNVNDNEVEFEDAIRFTDETMDSQFYDLSQRISSNTPLKGKVIEATNRTAIIDLGAYDGVRVGDRLVIYKNIAIRAEGTAAIQASTRRSNIGLLTITKVGDHSSEGVYFQTIEIPQNQQFVITYLEKAKQINLINSVRKELDTHLRNVFEIEKKVVIQPISIEDLDKKKWIYLVRATENERDWWESWLLGSGAASGYFLLTYNPGNSPYLPLASMVTFAYTAVRFFQTKGQIRSLVEEGKFKGYLDVTFRPDLPQSTAVPLLHWETKF